MLQSPLARPRPGPPRPPGAARDVVDRKVSNRLTRAELEVSLRYPDVASG
ncbi:hypothetical protein [Planctomyces sp. SH-PL62]|nr:hypothetical protein [Planctomyces sp. SH-PL62]